MPYRQNCIGYIPRRKDELIEMIVRGGWNGTKTALKAMERKQLLGIFYDMRQKAMNKIMRNPVPAIKEQAQASEKAVEE